jgi:Notch-like protein
VTETATVCTVKSVNNKNSSGFDEISSELLNLSKPLACIYTSSVSQGKFPDCLKHSVVVLVFKNGDKPLIANYRPISLLTGFSKIYELLIDVRLIQLILQ